MSSWFEQPPQSRFPVVDPVTDLAVRDTVWNTAEELYGENADGDPEVNAERRALAIHGGTPLVEDIEMWLSSLSVALCSDRPTDIYDPVEVTYSGPDIENVVSNN